MNPSATAPLTRAQKAALCAAARRFDAGTDATRRRLFRRHAGVGSLRAAVQADMPALNAVLDTTPAALFGALANPRALLLSAILRAAAPWGGRPYAVAIARRAWGHRTLETLPDRALRQLLCILRWRVRFVRSVRSAQGATP